LTTEPLVHTYDATLATLVQAGYVPGEDLFVANYDWRLPRHRTTALSMATSAA